MAVRGTAHTDLTVIEPFKIQKHIKGDQNRNEHCNALSSSNLNPPSIFEFLILIEKKKKKKKEWDFRRKLEIFLQPEGQKTRH